MSIIAMPSGVKVKKVEFAEPGTIYYIEPNWDKGIPELIKIIRKNPNIFAPIKETAESLNSINIDIMFAKGRKQLAKSTMSTTSPDSQAYKKAQKDYDLATNEWSDLCGERSKLVWKLHEEFYLNYYALCNYAVLMSGKIIKSGKDELKIRKEYENNPEVIKLREVICKDMHVYNGRPCNDRLLDNIINSGKLPREDKWNFPELE